MNCKNFDVFIVCNGYSKQLAISLYYWSKINYNNYRIIIISSQKDQETQRLYLEYKDKLNLFLVLYKDDNYHHKGLLLQYGIDHFKQSLGDYIFFSDADMVFPMDILTKVNLNMVSGGSRILSSYREDIAPEHIDLLINNYQKEDYLWPWLNLRRKILYPSPFMGWFLVIPSKIIDKINFYPDHDGYDVIDWKIYGQAKSLVKKEEIIYFDHMPLHLYHGKKGINWRGITL